MSSKPDGSSHNLASSDTFLSRVFGLHSIYNRLHENYHYFDDSEYLPSVGQLATSASVPAPPQNAANTLLLNSANLLDSEPDLDASLSPPSPLLAAFTNPQASVNWDTNVRFGRGEPVSPQGGNGLPIRNGHNVSKLGTSNGQAAQFPPTSTGLDGRSSDTNTVNFQLPLYNNPTLYVKPRADPPRPQYPRARVSIPPKERALYLWANIVNMDEFLVDVYYYYRGKGFASIVLSRVVDVLILVFILAFSTFLRWGIDYHHFFHEWSSNSDVNLTLRDLVIPHYLSTVPLSVKFLLAGFTAYIGLRLLQLYFDYKYKLAQLQNFYKHLLDIHSDLELMTISWLTIVERLMALKDYNSMTASNFPRLSNDLNSKVRLNAHDIANRIMRKENYMIALINKDVLDLSVPCPAFLDRIFSSKSVLTRTLEWNIKLCINNFVFDDNGQISKAVLSEASRNLMAHELSARFKMAAIINVVLCPFIVIYFVLLYFFRYFNEYKSNPSSLLGLRQYTPWAEWKLREFNELSHLFIKRLHLSIGPANTYINQFPGSVFAINAMALVNFISGAIMAVLVIMGLLFEDEEHNFWSFELSENRSTLFYISVFGTLWAITSSTTNTSIVTNTAENLNSQEVSFFYDPEASLRYVSQFTHYLPSSWNGKLHTVEVKNKFCDLYSLKILIIVNEILSVFLTPFVLWFKISGSLSAIIDFFREYTIHVDGLGYVCYFAMFNFEEKDKNTMAELNRKKKGPRRLKKRKDDSDSSDLDSELNDYYQDDKMIKSYMYFLESYDNKAGKRGPGKKKRASGTAAANPTSILAKKSASHNTNGDSLQDLSYNFPEALEESMRPRDNGRKGVLGMINQFSKQETGR